MFMVMQGRGKPWLICFLAACTGVISADPTFLELLDFLGQWTDEQGTAIDFDMFNDSKNNDGQSTYPESRPNIDSVQ